MAIPVSREHDGGIHPSEELRPVVTHSDCCCQMSSLVVTKYVSISRSGKQWMTFDQEELGEGHDVSGQLDIHDCSLPAAELTNGSSHSKMTKSVTFVSCDYCDGNFSYKLQMESIIAYLICFCSLMLLMH